MSAIMPMQVGWSGRAEVGGVKRGDRGETYTLLEAVEAALDAVLFAVPALPHVRGYVLDILAEALGFTVGFACAVGDVVGDVLYLFWMSVFADR